MNSVAHTLPELAALMVTCNSLIDVSWLINGNKIASPENIVAKNSLLVPQMSQSKAGIYTCEGKTQSGRLVRGSAAVFIKSG